MEYRDYYKVLGIDRGATQAEIKKSFRRLARDHHPDRNPGDKAAERRFKEINEANEVLSDPDKRRRYDALGANWDAFSRAGAGGGTGPFGAGGPFAGFTGGAAGPGNVRFEFHTTGDASGFSDFFRTFFGGASAGAAPTTAGGRRRRAASGAPDEGGPSFDDILAGMGIGAPGPAGFGSGGVAYRPAGGAFRSPVADAPASVEAEVELSLEEAFHGTSRIVVIDGKRLEVRVPRGVETGSRIRLKGKGGGDPEHPADLYLVTRVLHHPTFTRIGADLTRELPITLAEALLGAEIPVTTLKGRVLLTIPAGTQAGRTFRLKGQGMPRLKAKPGEPETGDLLVRIKIVLPTKLSPEAQSVAKRLVELVDQPDPRRTTN